ncbi:hypothetical protein [Amycolatopsis sp. NBC_01480]|uniref:hypothetical protein n=1 Tax=Amycolatopsis sp. NBC_01480 TaxID=2903562 RepID=UPI002E2AEE4E|nr:hypothetical protein [Amycolatopsis sp. NBC_01480]
MGKVPRYAFPLALLGFAELAVTGVQLATAQNRPVSYDVAVAVKGDAGFTTQQLVGGPGSVHAYSQPPLVPATSVPAGFAPSNSWLIMLALVVAAVLAGYAVAAPRAGTPYRTGRFVLVLVGGVLAVPLLDLLAFTQFGLPSAMRGPALAALGLLLLAWYERSVFVAVVSVLFAVLAAVLMPSPAGVVLSGAVLLAAAFAAVAGPAKWRPRPAAGTG